VIADPDNTLTLATQNVTGSGPLTKAGQGGLHLGGSIASTAVSVQDGILLLSGTGPQLTGSPAIALENVATFAFSNHNETVSAINLTGGTIDSGTGTLNLTGSLNYARSIWPAAIQGNLSLGASAGAFFVDHGSSTDLTISANISGSPAGGLVETGDGLLTLCGSNTYSGGTTVSSGTLLALAPGALPDDGLIVGADGASLFATNSLGASLSDVESLDLVTPGDSNRFGGDLAIPFSLDTPAVLAAISQPASNPVPEPDTLLLLLAAGGGGLLRRLRRQPNSGPEGC
jgi:autotransporter-associated beta strand protein